MLPIYSDLQIVARSFGTKHPQSLGQPASACWPEIWHITGHRIETTYHGGPGTWMEDLRGSQQRFHPDRYYCRVLSGGG
jgi:hypothetical protein